MKVITLADYQRFASDKMKKNNLFQTSGCSVISIALSLVRNKRGISMATRTRSTLFWKGREHFRLAQNTACLRLGKVRLPPQEKSTA